MCTCEPGAEIPVPHAPWLCRMNDRWDEHFDPDCLCGFNFVAETCPVHGWVIPLADEPEWVA